ncbi:Yip1 family protein [Dokdonella sp.]|uniref:Yip1 family protein n=1 Tax=Dokdonella sp. TaxID=2291710 RepID=UPI001B2125AA|nr:Yip1 family protein [Dokdonella sp.]MBO9664328.1 YIP1 family protein [Dokdonella sp.]
MDFNKLIARAKAILTTPKTEWPVIAGESTTVPDLYKNYIAILAAIPAVVGFVKGSLIGYSAFGVNVRVPVGAGLTAAILGYVLSLALVYVMALIIDALAPTFGGQKNQVQALKAVGYSYTASWVANVGLIVPWIGFLIALAGGIYAIYLLYLGLPATMKAPPEKAAGYTVVSILAAIVLGWILSLVVAGVVGTNAMMGGAAISGAGGQVSIDGNSPAGQLDAWSKKMEAAGKQMEAAQKSGDAAAQSKALGAVIAAAGGGEPVEALAPDVLKPFVPETLAGLKRTDFSAERNGALGMQVSEARATYSDGGDRRVELEVTDMGSAKGLMALAGWAALDSQKETDHGYEKTYKQDGRLVHEEWNGQDKHGEYAVVVGERFSVKARGNADSIDQLKAAVAGIDLGGLEALKTQGVKKS